MSTTKSNREFKEAFRQLKPRMGVYQIRNTVTGKTFIGSNLNADAVWNRFQSELRFNGHRNAALQQDRNDYGPSRFLFEILAEAGERTGENVDYAKELKALELLYIGELQPFGARGYNPSKRLNHGV